MKILSLAAFVAALFLVGCDANAPPSNDAAANAIAPTVLAPDNGLKTVKSQNTFAVTYAKLKSAIEKNEQLKLIAEIDHAENADKANLKLRPTRVLIFGNPKLGTPLMNQAQTLAIDLPQKMLVYETATGEVFVAYNDPLYLAKRHNIDPGREELGKVANALKTLVETAPSK